MKETRTLASSIDKALYSEALIPPTDLEKKIFLEIKYHVITF
jgi:hypothetical protein